MKSIEEQNRLLIHEVEQLILHAEEDTLDYSVLEHARKLIFDITSKCSFKKQCESESEDYQKQFCGCKTI